MASGQTACFLRAANVGDIIAIKDMGLLIFTDQATRMGQLLSMIVPSVPGR